jgi:hypothetical protein
MSRKDIIIIISNILNLKENVQENPGWLYIVMGQTDYFLEMRLMFHISSFSEEITRVVPYLDKWLFIRWKFGQLLPVFYIVMK